MGKTSEANLDIQHPKLGRLVYEEEGWWLGQIAISEYEIKISIDGNENGLDVGLDKICLNVLNHFSEFYEKALVLLKLTVLNYKIPIPLEFTPFEILWIWKKVNTDGFTIRFNDNHDSHKLWRVSFENGEAIYCGYDD